jgi:hypothetical protein
MLRDETNALLGQDDKDVDAMIKALARRGRDAAGGP